MIDSKKIRESVREMHAAVDHMAGVASQLHSKPTQPAMPNVCRGRYSFVSGVEVKK